MDQDRKRKRGRAQLQIQGKRVVTERSCHATPRVGDRICPFPLASHRMSKDQASDDWLRGICSMRRFALGRAAKRTTMSPSSPQVGGSPNLHEDKKRGQSLGFIGPIGAKRHTCFPPFIFTAANQRSRPPRIHASRYVSLPSSKHIRSCLHPCAPHRWPT
jgi:hypothetical protein